MLSSAPTTRPTSPAMAKAQELVAKYVSTFVPMPTGPIPTLGNMPDGFHAIQADELQVRANRWLEYVDTLVAASEAILCVLKGELGSLERGLKFKYKGKVDEKATAAEMEELDALARTACYVEAELTLQLGWKDRLNKVKQAASRTISRQKDGGGGSLYPHNPGGGFQS